MDAFRADDLPPARWRLDRTDYDRLARLLQELPDFRTPDRRVDLVDDLFAGSPRQSDLVGMIDVSGTPRAAAVRLLNRLMLFGQDEPGQETLGVLVNKLLSYVGGGDDADFLRSLFQRYPLRTVPVSTRGLSEWRGQESAAAVQEKLIGENTLRDVRVLELALAAAKGVVRIRGEMLGSGFLAGTNLVMTCHHVIPTQAAAHASMIQFNYQLDRQGMPAPDITVRAKPGGLFYANAALDFAVVEIEDAPPDAAPLALARLRASKEERVNIIQHPGGHYKKISMQNNFVAYADDQIIQYLTSTEKGSSGAPVFNNDFVVIGVHHGGGMVREPHSERRYLRNEGSTLIAILDDLQRHAPAIYQRLRPLSA